MRRAAPRRRSSERGTILILTLVVGLMISLAIAGATMTAVTSGKNSQFGLNRTAALALAEGVTETVQKEMLATVANFETFALSGWVTIDGESYPFTITPIGSPQNRVDIDGVTMAVQTYEIASTVEVDTASATVRRVVDLTMTPIFQYMIFFSDDLEILPGPDMTLQGRVHSNADIYVGAGSTLTVDTDYFRSTGEILRRRKNDNSPTGGTVDIKVFEESSFKEMVPGDDSSNSDWLKISNDTWEGTVQSGAHGVKEIASPEIGSIKAYDLVTGEKGHYHENAGLVIIDDAAYDADGNAVSLPAGTISEKTMYDAREGKIITVTEIDIAKLNTSGEFPSNGLLYAYRTDASADQPNGVRLTNGSELAGPLSVVTEDPLYVHGDYNTVNKKGASVMADAVNLLSNAWDDSKSPGSLPNASATQYNVAMVTGNVPTPDGGGNYSGGFENLPRFHERWSGVTATIRGSFIKIFESEIARSPWRYGGDVYTAPRRNWMFDSDLQNIANMPPFTPNAVYFTRVLWDDGLPLPF